MPSKIPASERSLTLERKYHQAAYGFFFLNLVYMGIALWFLLRPPINAETLPVLGTAVGGLAVFAGLSWAVHRGFRGVVLILILIYGLRIGVSVYQLMEGEAFPVVPYVLPILPAVVYLLGRPVWNWP